jgi:hypothetical protein
MFTGDRYITSMGPSSDHERHTTQIVDREALAHPLEEARDECHFDA